MYSTLWEVMNRKWISVLVIQFQFSPSLFDNQGTNARIQNSRFFRKVEK